MTTVATLVAALAEHATTSPDRRAVSDDSRALTYAQLDHEVAVLAEEIASHSPSPGAPLGVLVDQGVDAVVALYAVMRAGRIALPLDNAAPSDAVRAIIGHAGAAAIVTDERSRRLLGAGIEPIVLGSRREGSTADLRAASVAVGEDDPAVIFYTSGSTGRPKGFVMGHGPQVRGARSWCEAYGVRPDDRVALLFHYSFGASRVSMYGALIVGAELRVYDAGRGATLAVAPRLHDDGVTFVHCAPSLLRAMLESLPEGPNLPNVRVLVTGAEALHRRDIDQFRRHVWPGCRLAYTYAVSEAGPVAAWLIDSGTDIGDEPLPLGTTLPGKRVTIADPRIDGIGEIVVAGEGLADGYWRDDERTAERFGVADDDPAVRWFRTGDRGRLRTDGVLEYHGRLGTVVNVRGFSVDMAEVERALRALESFDDVAVVLHQARRERLVAYVVPDVTQPPVDVVRVRAVLADRLPAYMVPAMFVVLDALPRTGRGKVDVRALPAVPTGRPALSTGFVAPRDDVERAVTKAWEQVLEVGPIGVDDDFFELGGDSLAAAESIFLLQDTLGRDVPLAAFLEASTAAALAGMLRSGGERRWMSPVVPLRTEGSRPPFFCVHGRGGDVMVFRPLADGLSAEQPFYALQIVGAPPSAVRSVERLAAYYLEDVRRVQPHGPYLLGGYSSGASVAFEMARQLAAAGERPALVANIDGVAPEIARTRHRLGRVTRAEKWMRLEARWILWRLAWVRWRVGQKVFRRSGPSPWRDFTKQSKFTRRMMHRYRAGPYDGRVLLLRSTRYRRRADLGWGEHVTGPLEVVDVAEGTHRSILAAPHVDVIARRLDAALADACAEAPT
ncbi:MAG: hypothetical protein QOD92_4191 [Acidimicrobiaceae bacterium]